MPTGYHIPVLCDEAVNILVTSPRWTYVDGTVGGGGHAERICEALSSEGRLVAFDWDGDAIASASRRLARFGERVILVQANFRAMGSEIRRLGIAHVGGVLLDLGVSSFQLDEGARGFSYRGEGQLDMRMDRRQLLSAFDVVNGYSEQSLIEILFRYGEERQARRVARGIVAGRPITTTAGLRRVVEETVGSRFLLNSLARVFQALRIEVNRELDNLAAVLAVAVELLLPGGRLVVISYHSLEDRIVKEFFRRESATVVPSGHKLVPDVVRAPLIRVLTPHPRAAAPEEIAANPRARSAKLRAAERLPQAD